MERLKTIEWINDAARIIDQTRLPAELAYEEIRDSAHMFDAIRALKIRGAPAIGVAAAYGLYLGVRAEPDSLKPQEFLRAVDAQADYLAGARPTAVNLFWALERMKTRASACAGQLDAPGIKKALLDEAHRILAEDRRICRRIGEHGYDIVRDVGAVLTHCNAGGLATAEFGTALAPIYVAQERGKLLRVFADETRPLLQGARITSFELAAAGIPVTVICDNMAAVVMARGLVDAVIVGADRIAANGDAANKIGTYGVALLAKAHNKPFYVAAPSSTFDLDMPDGSHIPIEERDRAEIAFGMGKQTVPDGVETFNPAFDVTPHELITAIITEAGVLRPPFGQAIESVIGPLARSPQA
jgi:methylthioribose-1-phosphate isomerase